MDEKGTGRKRKDLIKKLCYKLQMYHKMGYNIYYDEMLLKPEDTINFIEINKKDYRVYIRSDNVRFNIFDNVEECDMPKADIIPYFTSLFRVIPKIDFDWVYN